jgi:hypothetical protein
LTANDCLVGDKDEEARERDQMRYERHKDRQRERNIARAAPDKRLVLKIFIVPVFQLQCLIDGANNCHNYKNESNIVTLL